MKVVLRGSCPRESCPRGISVLWGSCPRVVVLRVLVPGIVVLEVIVPEPGPPYKSPIDIV